jgi:hypothetical protein
MDEEKLLRDLCRAPAEGEDDWQQKLAAAQGAKRLAWDLPTTPAQGRKIFVEPLSVLMSHHSGSVAVTAASALGALADGDPSVQQALSSSRALQELVRLLRNDLVPGLSWRVASIIGRLAAQVEDMDTKLMQADGFKALEEQLDVQDAHSQAKAAAVLGILAQSEVGRQRIISFRRAPRLVHMSWSQDSSVRLAAVRLLALLAIDDEETRLCAGSDEGDHNCIHLLVGNGQRGSEQDAAAGDLVDGSVRVNAEALSDFSNIKFHGIIARGIGEIALRAAQLLARILDGGRSGVFNHHALEVALAARGEDALVRMLKDGEVANAIAAAEVLGLMARESTDAQQAIAAAGGTHALVALSRPTPEADVDPNTDTTQRYAALDALNSVATESADIRTRIVKEGGAETAVLAAEVKELQLPALRLLALLAKDDFSMREIVRHEGINGVGIVLRSILNHTDAIGKELQRESCAEDGSNFTISEDTYLRPRGILEAAASAVARLAERDQTGSIQGIMLHDGLVESLCALAQLDASLLPTQTQLPVLAALAAVADGNARTQARIVKYDGLVHIVHAAVSTQEAVQSRAVLALLAFLHAVRPRSPQSSPSISAQFGVYRSYPIRTFVAVPNADGTRAEGADSNHPCGIRTL